MRSSKSRSRSKSNRNRPSGGNVINRVFDSSGPEGKVRGTPQQIIDKYNQLARDAQLSNDRVAAENFQQHAEHYLRLLGEAQREIDARREEQERQNRERQAERDRDRTDRQERESPGRAPDPAETQQPDVLGTPGAEIGEDEPMLVETPENAPKKPSTRRARGTSRKPASPRTSDATGETQAPGDTASPEPAAKDPAGAETATREKASAKPARKKTATPPPEAAAE